MTLRQSDVVVVDVVPSTSVYPPSPPRSPAKGKDWACDVVEDHDLGPQAQAPKIAWSLSSPDAPQDGVEHRMGSTAAYVVGLERFKKGDGCIVLLPDAFGWTLPTFRKIADTLARTTPFLVVLPDILDGGLYPTAARSLLDPPPPPAASYLGTLRQMLGTTITNVSVMGSLGSSKAVTLSANPPLDEVDALLVALAELGVDGIGIAGYGCGGGVAVNLAGRYPARTKDDNVPRITCFAVIDPSGVGGLTSIRRIKVDSLWICSSTEDSSGFPLGLRDATKKELKSKIGIVSDFMDVPACVGFAIRGHWGGVVADCADAAVARVAEFLVEFL